MGKKTTNMQDVQSPYLAARREWNERYGDYIQAARTWQIIGILGLATAITATAGTIYFASQNKLIPYVVEVDARGNTVAVYESSLMADADTRVVRAQLAQFIRDLRSVSADLTVQKEAVRRIYTHLNGNNQGTAVVNEWFSANDPFRRSQKMTVGIDILQLLPLSDKTWQIEWSEQEYARDGKILGKNNYTATATISTGNRVDAVSILYNPIGLSVDELHVSADFKGRGN